MKRFVCRSSPLTTNATSMLVAVGLLSVLIALAALGIAWYLQTVHHAVELVDRGGWKLKKGVYESPERCDLPRINLKTVNKDALRDLIRSNVPFVLEGEVERWAARSEWQRENLREKFHDRHVKIDSESSIVQGGGFVAGTKSFGDVLDTVRNCSTKYTSACSDHFVFDTEVLRAIPEFNREVKIPAVFQDWDNRKFEQENRMWHILSLGSIDTGLPMHSHGKTWLAVVFGAKSWYVYPPGFGVPHHVSDAFSSLQSVKHWQTNIFTQYLQHLPKPMLFNQSTLRMTKNPLATSDVQPLYCLQRAGEIVYLPDLWSHLTVNEGETIAYGGQIALFPEARYEAALRVLANHPKDFETLKNAALGRSHMTLMRLEQIRRSIRPLSSSALLSIQSSAPMTSVSLLQLSQPSQLKDLVQWTEDVWVVLHVSHSATTNTASSSTPASTSVSAKAFLRALLALAEENRGKLNVAVWENDVQYLIQLAAEDGRVLLSDVQVTMDSKPILRATVRYVPQHLESLDTLIEDIRQWITATIHVYYLDEPGSVMHGVSRAVTAMYRETQGYLREALEQRPSHLESWRLLAELAGSLGYLEYMREVIDQATGIFDALLVREQIGEMSTKETSVATQTDKKEGISNKAFASVYHQLATSYLSVQMAQEALPLLLRALSLEARYTPALVDIVVAHSMCQDGASASQALQNLTLYFPQHPDIPRLQRQVRSLK